MMARLKELEDENRRLKKRYAEERLKADILKEAIEKSGEAVMGKPISICLSCWILSISASCY